MAGKKKVRRNPVASFFGFGVSGTGTRSAEEKKTAPVSRPAGAQARGSDAQVPVAAHSFSGHFITFAIVVAIIAISVYGPLSSFIKQQNEINDAKANIAALQDEQGSLKAQVSWWEDDNYVKQQARSRLFYVEPGQTPYLVVGLDSTSELADDTSAAAKTAPEDSWTTKLWGSMQIAAEEPEASQSAEPAPEATETATESSAPTSGTE